LKKEPEAVQKGCEIAKNIINFVMPDPRSPERDRLASPAYINGWRSRIKCGMTTFLNSLTF